MSEEIENEPANDPLEDADTKPTTPHIAVRTTSAAAAMTKSSSSGPIRPVRVRLPQIGEQQDESKEVILDDEISQPKQEKSADSQDSPSKEAGEKPVGARISSVKQASVPLKKKRLLSMPKILKKPLKVVISDPVEEVEAEAEAEAKSTDVPWSDLKEPIKAEAESENAIESLLAIEEATFGPAKTEVEEFEAIESLAEELEEEARELTEAAIEPLTEEAMEPLIEESEEELEASTEKVAKPLVEESDEEPEVLISKFENPFAEESEEKPEVSPEKFENPFAEGSEEELEASTDEIVKPLAEESEEEFKTSTDEIVKPLAEESEEESEASTDEIVKPLAGESEEEPEASTDEVKEKPKVKIHKSEPAVQPEEVEEELQSDPITQDSTDTFVAPVISAIASSPFARSESFVEETAAQPMVGNPVLAGKLIAKLVVAPHASGDITSKDLGAALEIPGIAAVVLSDDIGDRNRLVPLREDGRLLAEDQVNYWGQPVAIVVGETEEACRAAIQEVKIEYHNSPGILNIEHAIAMNSTHGTPQVVSRGDVAQAVEHSKNRLNGTVLLGGQLSAGRESLGARVEPLGDDRYRVTATTEHPSRLRICVAHALKTVESRVQIVCEPLSGATGGREVEAAFVATLAAVAAAKTQRTVTLQLDAVEQAMLGGKRHETQATYTVGFDQEGVIAGADIQLALDGGHAAGDSGAALDRALLHAEASYFIPHLSVKGQLYLTNRVTSGSLPAEGAAQGSIVMEEIISRIAQRLNLPAETVRTRNLYRSGVGESQRDTTPYGQPVPCEELHTLWNEGLRISNFADRRAALKKWNASNPCYKRGIAAVPFKYGASDPRSDRNQAAAMVQVMTDGSIKVELGCVDVGDGLQHRMARIAAGAFGLPFESVSVFCGDTNSIPQSTARLGLDTGELMAGAVTDACAELKRRLRPVSAQLLAADGALELDEESIRFFEGKVSSGLRGSREVPFEDVAYAGWRRRTNLAAVGFYRTPNLWWDPEVGAGWPFAGFVIGAAIAEVQIDAFTGEAQILRLDFFSNGDPEGRSGIVRGLSTGFGWMISEGLTWDDSGALMNATAEDYAMPGFADQPLEMNIHLTGKSKGPAPGFEAPVIAATSVREAIRESIRAFGQSTGGDAEVDLPLPATPEAILRSLRDLSRRIAAAKKAG